MTASREAVVVDTNVFGAALTRRGASLQRLYAPHPSGRGLVLAAQTVAELRFGVLLAQRGEARQAALERRIGRARAAAGDEDLVWEVARLCVRCRRTGHALADNHHASDLWIAAATAIHYELALVAHDGMFRRAPWLDLLTELP